MSKGGLVVIRTEKDYTAAIREHADMKDRLARLRLSLQEQGYTEDVIADLMDSELAFAQQIGSDIELYERASRRQFGKTDGDHIGLLLINLRIANRVKQRDLADRLGVDESVVSRDERNEYRGITVERAQRILQALDERVELSVAPKSAANSQPSIQTLSASGASNRAAS